MGLLHLPYKNGSDFKPLLPYNPTTLQQKIQAHQKFSDSWMRDSSERGHKPHSGWVAHA